MTPLRKIEAAILAIVQSIIDGKPADPHDLRIIARQVGAQAEAHEMGLSE